MGVSHRITLPAVLVSLLLAACGGGGGGDDGNTDGGSNGMPITGGASNTDPGTSILDPNAPEATNDTATDGLNWFNFRRQQIGLAPVVRNARIDLAAKGHSDYQRLNNVITHQQTPGNPGFTGVELGDRLDAAGYEFSGSDGYAYGEVISSTFDRSGFNAAEDLIAAIYHRFVIFEPIFREAGAGAATVSGGNTYFTTNFAANGLDGGLGTGRATVYPFPGQERVPRNFMSDNEAPDPVPQRNEVGYPISVHADITSTIGVQSFTVSPRGGTPLPVQLLTSEVDPQTPGSVAAIIPLNVLLRATTYEVQFTGTVDGVPHSRNWSFTTQ